MGLYLRKSFRVGPLRLNLSKSGLGLSGGIKGARVGVGPRGTYVHGGRHGLYYRKHLGSGRSRARPRPDSVGCGAVVLAVIALALGLRLFQWLLANPAVLCAGIAVATAVPASLWLTRRRRREAIAAYRQSLDSAFVMAQAPPAPAVLASLSRQQQELPRTQALRRAVEEMESDVYQAVLDRVLDDAGITDEETAMLRAAEKTLRISPDARLQASKEIFSAAYLEVIQDREITRAELGRLNNLITGLAIPPEEVRDELDMVREIVDTQALQLPFAPLPPERLAAPTQTNEDAYYQCHAQVLSKRKSRRAPTGYAYTIRRDGTLILTNKRVFVVGHGTTNIRFSDIGDVDVDMDAGVVEITKVGSGRPIVLKTDAPVYTARAIDLLVNAQAGGGAA